MKRYLLLLMCFSLCGAGKSQQPQVPLFRPMFNDFVYTLSYSNCLKNAESLEYLGNSWYLDGGSVEYYFRTTGENRINIFFPNPGTWGRKLYRSGLQPVLLSTNSVFANCYLLIHDSPEEKNLLSILRSAKAIDRTDGVYTNLPSISAIISIIETRTPLGGLDTYSEPREFVTGSYLKGLKHGTWTSWDGNSNKTEETEFLYGLKHGREISWIRNDTNVQTFETYYCSNVLHGKYTVYLNDNIMEDRWYNYGKEEGISVTYHKNGRVKRIYKCNNGVVDGPNITFYENGRMECFIEYTTGVWSGLSVTWHSNGQTDTILRLVKEPDIYQTVSWHTNGIMKEFGHKKGYDYTGVWTTWDSDGTVSSKGEYINGQKQGEWFQRSADRRSSEKGTYTTGKKKGPWRYYDSNGVVTVEVTYSNGIPVSSPCNDKASLHEYARKVTACMVQLSNDLAHIVFTNKAINGIFEYLHISIVSLNPH